MNYTDLLIEADKEQLITKEKPLQAYNGRIKGNRIAIRKNMPTIEKTCVLAEELGHHYTTSGDIIEQSSIMNQKQELRARLWAYNKLIGLQGLISAYQHGCSSIHEAAEYLEVTEEFLLDAISAYRKQYGCYTQVDNYLIFFEPSVGVMELL